MPAGPPLVSLMVAFYLQDGSRRLDRLRIHHHSDLATEKVKQNGHALAVVHALEQAEIVAKAPQQTRTLSPGAKAGPSSRTNPSSSSRLFKLAIT